MGKYKPRKETIEKVASYLGRELHNELCLNDAVYLYWKAQEEIFMREVDKFRQQCWDEWNRMKALEEPRR